MTKRFTARLIISTLLATMPGPDFYVLAASMAKTPVKIAPVAVSGRLSAPSFNSGAPLLTPTLNAPSPLVQGTLTPSGVPQLTPIVAAQAATPEQVKAPVAARVVLDAAVKDAAAVTSAAEAPAATQKDAAARTFDLSAPRQGHEQSAVMGTLTHAPSPLSLPTDVKAQTKSVVARPAKGAPVKAAWSLKKRILTSAAVVAAAGGLTYVLNALGMPEAALGLMPLIGLAGTLGSSSGPSDAQVEEFYGHVVERLQPGDVIGGDSEKGIADEMGLDGEAAGAILLKLAQQNRIAAFNNGTFILTDVADRARKGSSHESLAKGDQLAFEGLKAVNSDSTSEHVRALKIFDRAMAQYKQYEVGTHSGAPGRRQVLILKQNAYIETLGDVLRAYDNGLKKMEAADANAAPLRQKVAMAMRWVNDSYFAKDHTPEMLESASHQWLMKVVDAYIKGLPSAAKTPEMLAGFALLQEFVDGLGPEDETDMNASSDYSAGDKSRRQLTAGNTETSGPSATPAPKKGFPLMEKGDSRVETLSKYGINVTGQAVREELSPLIGRKKEIRQMVKTLLRVEKNNPVVVGEGGVGKTKIVEGLAQMIVDGKIPELAGKNVFKLDLTAVVAGTKYRGEFEERMQKIMDEVKASKGQIILFIDELHRILGAGNSEGGNDASQILKDRLSTGDISVIGATTLSEYRKIEKDAALKRRFNMVKLEPPSPEEAVEIIMGVKARYEKKHKVAISEKTVKDAVATASRYITDRHLPDSALDLLDDAAAEVELKASETADKDAASREVTSADIGFEISLRTGIPAGQVSADDMELLKSLPEELQKRLVGQDQAVQAVVRAIRRGRLGYRDTKRPVGVFALLGPTGVGKTHLARTLAKHLFRSEKAMVRIDMSEYKEKFAMSRLIGAPPGYVGHEGEGQLTEPVRRNPHSVVLFDEIDKADPEVLDLLLQILDDGRITDSQGRVIDFSNTIIMMSANTGGSLAQREAQSQDKPRRAIGFHADWMKDEKEAAAVDPSGETEEQRQAGYLEAFKAKMRPEFFNRIGKRNVVVFNTLGRPELEKILEINIADLNGRLKAKGMTLELSAAAKRYLVDDAYRPENRNYGARPLNQTVENELETALVDAEIGRLIANGDSVVVDVVDGALVVAKK